MEDEARESLRSILSEEPMPTGNLADRIRRRVEPLGGIELELPPRGSIREPPDFR
jgi:plasmid stability protein